MAFAGLRNGIALLQLHATGAGSQGEWQQLQLLSRGRSFSRLSLWLHSVDNEVETA
jgi:hypothetical protein